jgi:hypothetical protein
MLCASIGAVPAYAQNLGLAPNHNISPWRIVGALLFCLVLGIAGAFALQFRLRGKAINIRSIKTTNWRALLAGLGTGRQPVDCGAQRLRLVETVRLGYQVEVNLLECDGKGIVVVTSPHGAFIANPDAPDTTGTSA